MSFWDTVKGWFNIGGVTVKITRVEDPFPSQDTVMKGNYTLTTKIPKTVLSTQVEFYAEEKYREREKEGEEEKENGLVRIMLSPQCVEWLNRISDWVGE